MLYRIGRLALIGIVVLLLGAGIAWSGAQAGPSRQATVTPTPAGPLSDIGVSGTGQLFASPDTAIAMLGVEITGPTLAAATADASKNMSAVLDKIKSLGVSDKDIQTTSYSVNPITSNPKEGETPRITGYHVSNIVQVKIRKLDDVGTILDAAVAAGANSLNSLNFTIDDPSSLQQQARTKAVQDAMAKAKTLADAAGVKLGPITSITENVQIPRPLVDRFAAPAALGAGSAPGPVESGQLQISVTVEVHYQIAQ